MQQTSGAGDAVGSGPAGGRNSAGLMKGGGLKKQRKNTAMDLLADAKAGSGTFSHPKPKRVESMLNEIDQEIGEGPLANEGSFVDKSSDEFVVQNSVDQTSGDQHVVDEQEVRGKGKLALSPLNSAKKLGDGAVQSTLLRSSHAEGSAAGFDVAKRVAQFSEDRANKMKKRYVVIISRAMVLVVCGFVFYIAGNVLRYQGADSNTLFSMGWIMVLVGIATSMVGVVGASLCPLKMVDLDKEMSMSNHGRAMVLGTMLVMSGMLAIYPPHLDAIAAPAVLVCLINPKRVLPSTAMCAWFVLGSLFGSTGMLCQLAVDLSVKDEGSGGGNRVLSSTNSTNDDTAVEAAWDGSSGRMMPDQIVLVTMAMVQAMMSALLAYIILQHNRMYRAHMAEFGEGGPGMNPTVYTYFAMYWRLVCQFLLETTLGVLALVAGEPDGWFRLMHGLIYAIPPTVVFYVGREHLFEIMAKRFEKHHAEADGAFIAEMLGTEIFVPGDTWWCHRDKPDLSFDVGEYERNWQEGEVLFVDLEKSEMVVGLPEEKQRVVRDTLIRGLSGIGRQTNTGPRRRSDPTQQRRSDPLSRLTRTFSRKQIKHNNFIASGSSKVAPTSEARRNSLEKVSGTMVAKVPIHMTAPKRTNSGDKLHPGMVLSRQLSNTSSGVVVMGGSSSSSKQKGVSSLSGSLSLGESGFAHLRAFLRGESAGNDLTPGSRNHPPSSVSGTDDGSTGQASAATKVIPLEASQAKKPEPSRPAPLAASGSRSRFSFKSPSVNLTKQSSASRMTVSAGKRLTKQSSATRMSVSAGKRGTVAKLSSFIRGESMGEDLLLRQVTAGRAQLTREILEKHLTESDKLAGPMLRSGEMDMEVLVEESESERKRRRSSSGRSLSPSPSERDRTLSDTSGHMGSSDGGGDEYALLSSSSSSLKASHRQDALPRSDTGHDEDMCGVESEGEKKMVDGNEGGGGGSSRGSDGSLGCSDERSGSGRIARCSSSGSLHTESDVNTISRTVTLPSSPAEANVRGQDNMTRKRRNSGENEELKKITQNLAPAPPPTSPNEHARRASVAQVKVDQKEGRVKTRKTMVIGHAVVVVDNESALHSSVLRSGGIDTGRDHRIEEVNKTRAVLEGLKSRSTPSAGGAGRSSLTGTEASKSTTVTPENGAAADPPSSNRSALFGKVRRAVNRIASSKALEGAGVLSSDGADYRADDEAMPGGKRPSETRRELRKKFQRAVMKTKNLNNMGASMGWSPRRAISVNRKKPELHRNDNSLGMRVYPQERLRTIKLSGGAGMNAEDLLKKAKENLRCIEWHTLTYELMKTSPLNSKVNFYQYSRPVAKGEVIDFFVSHSWSDNLDFKWPALEKLAADFLLVHGRYPTFWLDKVCIDQNNISDGLKVLPVNVMACRKMLVLCGETYVKRLWCAWELFTLFAFQDAEQALDKIMLVPLTDPKLAKRLGHDEAAAAGSPVLATLLNFNVADAMCYDPNEEGKVRRVIEAVGEESFNQRMKTLVHDVFAKRAELGKLGTHSMAHLKEVPLAAAKAAGRRMSSINASLTHIHTQTTGSLQKLSSGFSTQNLYSTNSGGDIKRMKTGEIRKMKTSGTELDDIGEH